MYGRPYAITEAIVQQAKTKARTLIFGSPADNVKYAFGVVHECRSLGHHFSVEYSDRKGIMKHITAVVINFEQQCLRKEEKKGFTLAEKAAFMEKWKQDNYDLMISVLGVKGTSLHFVSGIFLRHNSHKQQFHCCKMLYRLMLAMSILASIHCMPRMDPPLKAKCFPLDSLSFLEMKTRKVGLNSGDLSLIYILI